MDTRSYMPHMPHETVTDSCVISAEGGTVAGHEAAAGVGHRGGDDPPPRRKHPPLCTPLGVTAFTLWAFLPLSRLVWLLGFLVVYVCVCYSQDLATRNILVTTSNGEYQAKVTGTAFGGGRRVTQ